MSGPLFAAHSDPPERGEREVVRVALPVPTESLAALFDYAVPAALAGRVQPGCRVLVPFSGRRLTGVVVEAGREGALRLSQVERLIDETPALSPELLAAVREEADRTLCPVGLALGTALPAGSAPRMIRELMPTARGREALRSGALRGPARELLNALAEGPLTEAALVRRMRGAARALPALERDGLVSRRSRETSPTARRARIRVALVAEGLDVEHVCREQLARAPRQAELLRKLGEAKETPTAALASIHKGASSALRALVTRGFAEVQERELRRDIFRAPPPPDRPVELTSDQRTALAAIHDAIDHGEATSFLLHGVTGSGKTEIYLRGVERAIARGKRALVLVPEITLTHQIVARVRARFGDAVAVLHSGLRPGERLEQWERLRCGEVPIAVGARSALFAPIDPLGLIVIDEEHDPAYKNEEGFHYHARELAAARARAAGCPLVLGSATPALETRFAAERGSIQRLVLPRRIGGRPLPAVELVDLKAQRDRSGGGKRGAVTRPLRAALRETLAAGGQAILFLNRRGFSTKILCFECGTAERCNHCDVALVYHASQGLLRCHYCDFAKPPPDQCGGCGAPDSALLGTGTERLEEELRALLPEARIARLDRDTASRRGYTESVLRELRERKLDILVGTQIVAKGHDFPGVRLVGVIAADIGLHLPDFRAAERTFQLLTQVAGRAGRDAAPGRVLVQTFVPDHYALEPVLDHDYERFYRDEISHRRSLGYPPFGHVALALVSSEDEGEANASADALVREARDTARGNARPEIFGPSPAPLSRLRGRFRVQVLAKGDAAGPVREAARAFQRAALRLPKTVQASVDAHATSML